MITEIWNYFLHEGGADLQRPAGPLKVGAEVAECAGLNQGELQGTLGKAEALVSNPVHCDVPRPHLPDLAVLSAILRRTCGFHSHFFYGANGGPKETCESLWTCEHGK